GDNNVAAGTKAAAKECGLLAQLAGGAGKSTAPEAAQIKRHYHCVFYTFNGAFVTAVKFSQMAVATQCTFGKQTNYFTLLQQFVDASQGFFAIAGRNRNHPQTTQQWL